MTRMTTIILLLAVFVLAVVVIWRWPSESVAELDRRIAEIELRVDHLINQQHALLAAIQEANAQTAGHLGEAAAEMAAINNTILEVRRGVSRIENDLAQTLADVDALPDDELGAALRRHIANYRDADSR